MTKPTQNERQILDWLASQRGAMLALLETLVNTDSGSYDKAGVDAVGGHIRRVPRQPGHRQRSHAGTQPSATPSTPPSAIRAARNRPILLMGHRDTVFPKGEPTRRPFKIDSRARLWPRRLRHEVGPGDELLRSGRA